MNTENKLFKLLKAIVSTNEKKNVPGLILVLVQVYLKNNCSMVSMTGDGDRAKTHYKARKLAKLGYLTIEKKAPGKGDYRQNCYCSITEKGKEAVNKLIKIIE